MNKTLLSASVLCLLMLMTPDAEASGSRSWTGWLELGQGSDAHHQSLGAPNAGRLAKGQRLPASGLGFVRRERGFHYGTDETIALIHFVGQRLATAYPGSAPLLIGDISQREGGRLKSHRSHQSGRDVDIAIPELDPRPRRAFAPSLSPKEIDLERLWFVLETLIATGRVHMVFIDQRHLSPLRREARRAGWGDEELRRLFLMTPGRRGRGIIRHAPGHRTHVHVRFHCPLGATGCSG